MASIIAHLAVAIVVLLQKPMLTVREQERGPPEAVIPILIMPRTPPPAAGRLAQPAPIRLHRRPQRFVPPDVEAAPIAPPAPPAAARRHAAPRPPSPSIPRPSPRDPRATFAPPFARARPAAPIRTPSG